MNSMKNYCPTPSSAIRAMINGLRNQSQRDDFSVDMLTFGAHIGSTCFGCAATCAVQQATGINFTRDSIKSCVSKSKAVGVSPLHLQQFEYVIDDLRLGAIAPLFEYYDLDIPRELICLDLPLMVNSTWEDSLPAYEALAAELEKSGL